MSFNFDISQIDSIVTPSIAIGLFGLITYYFGRLIAVGRPRLNNDRFNEYYNGIFFMIEFLIIPLEIDIFVLTYVIAPINHIFLFNLLQAVYLIYLGIKSGWLTQLNKITRRDIIIFSVILFLTPVAQYLTSSITIMTIVSIFLIFSGLTVAALVFGAIVDKPQFVEVITGDTTIKGYLSESGDKFIKIYDGEKKILHVIPTKRVKLVRLLNVSIKQMDDATRHK